MLPFASSLTPACRCQDIQLPCRNILRIRQAATAYCNITSLLRLCKLRAKRPIADALSELSKPRSPEALY